MTTRRRKTNFKTGRIIIPGDCRKSVSITLIDLTYLRWRQTCGYEPSHQVGPNLSGGGGDARKPNGDKEKKLK